MSVMTVYHGTPYVFDTLRKGSWVAMTQEEAALHLFMKNTNSDVGDPLSGWIITIPDFDISLCTVVSELSDTERNMMTTIDILVDDGHYKRLTDVLPDLNPDIQKILHATEHYDLTELLLTD